MLPLLTLVLLMASACQGGREAVDEAAVDQEPRARPASLVADSAEAARRGFLAGYPALVTGGEHAHAVVEIPAGTSQKWMVNETSQRLVWERQRGQRRVIQYLAYPVNYGIVPRTLAWDGDPLDVLVLGPALPRGSVWAVRPIGVLRLTDAGERDDKILAVHPGGPLGEVRSLDALRRRHPGAAEIIETWFANYKGARGDLQARGYGDAAEARQIIREAAEAFES